MYTAYIGKRLIELINQREDKKYTAKAFFDEVYVPLFLGDRRFLQIVNNSEFDQVFVIRKTNYTKEKFTEALDAQHEKIQNNVPDSSFFVGGAAAKPSAKTSGQVTDIALPIGENEVYASWIGAAMGVGVSGGLNILIDADEVLLALYDGWFKYREYMKQTPMLKPHQVNTWNGYWITNVFDNRYDANYPFAEIPPIKTDAKTGIASIETTPWLKVIFALTQKMPEKLLNTYVYALSQMNTTVGFIAVELPAIHSFNELYQQISKESFIESTDAFTSLYDTALGFQKACELGKIGIPALEPKQLREYIPSGRKEAKPFKSPKDQNDPLIITYNLYQTWIIAMLNNKQLIELTKQFASVLNDFSNQKDRSKMTKIRSVDELLKAQNRKQFIEQLAKMLEENKENADQFDQLTDTVVLMPTTDFPLFMALLKLKYAVAQSK